MSSNITYPAEVYEAVLRERDELRAGNERLERLLWHESERRLQALAEIERLIAEKLVLTEKAARLEAQVESHAW
jgi:hypothetical protein